MAEEERERGGVSAQSPTEPTEQKAPAEQQAAPSNVDKVSRMGTGSIPKLIAEFAIPSIVGMLVNGAYNVISSIFLGQAMGELGLSTATAANPTMIIFMALAMLVGMGGNALAALRLGEGKRDAAEVTLGNTVFLALVLWVVVLVVAMAPPLISGLLTLSSATDEVRPYAQTFIQILSCGFIFQCVGMGVNNFIRTTGAPNRALLTMLIGAVSCTVFSFLFVMVFDWGVPGSALATICGQAVSCASVLWYFTITKNVALRLRLRNLRPHGETIRKILTLGLASFAAGGGVGGERGDQLRARDLRCAEPHRRTRCARFDRRGPAYRDVLGAAGHRRVGRHSAAARLQLRRAPHQPRPHDALAGRSRGDGARDAVLGDGAPVPHADRGAVRHHQPRSAHVHHLRAASSVAAASALRFPDHRRQLLPGDGAAAQIDDALALGARSSS